MPGFNRKAGSSTQVQGKGAAGGVAQVPLSKVPIVVDNENTKEQTATQREKGDTVINTNVVANISGDSTRSDSSAERSSKQRSKKSSKKPTLKDKIEGKVTQAPVVSAVGALSPVNSNVTQQQTQTQKPDKPLFKPPVVAAAQFSSAASQASGNKPATQSGRILGAVNVDNLIAVTQNINPVFNTPTIKPGPVLGIAGAISPLGPLQSNTAQSPLVTGVAAQLNIRPTLSNIVAELLESAAPTQGSPAAVTPSATPQPITLGANNSTIGYLPESKVDFYLKEAGLTSLYPSIIMTSKRDIAQIGNINPTSLFMEMNYQIKSQIEQEVSRLLLNKDTSQYDAYMTRADTYADLCIDASRKKDNFISLLNIATTSLSSNLLTGKTGQRNIGGNYTPLKGATSVISLLRAANRNYPTDVFIRGTNTHSILQFLKTLYFNLVFGGISFKDSYPDSSGISSGKLYGSRPAQLGKAIDDLIKINLSSIANPISTNLVKVDGFSQINMSNFKLGTDIASIIAFLTRDALIQSKKSDLNNKVPSTTYSGAITELIGGYTSEEFESNPYLGSKIISVQDLIAGGNAGQLENILVRPDNINKFGVLDTNKALITSISSNTRKTGIDYLLYDEIVDETTNVTLDNASSFVNSYDSQVANKIYELWDTSYSIEESKRASFSLGIADEFKTWITSTYLTQRGAISNNEAKFFRAVCFFIAAKDDLFAIKLFRLICALFKKGEVTRVPIKGTTAGSSELNTEINQAYLGVIFHLFGNDPLSAPKKVNKLNVSYDMQTGQGQSVSAQGRIDSLFKNFKSALTPRSSTAFNMFHRPVRNFETNLGINTSTPDLLDVVNLTDYSNKMCSDSRAFAVYSMFLSILRKTEFRVLIEEHRGAEVGLAAYKDVTLTYNPNHFKSILTALDKITFSPSGFESYLLSLPQDDDLFLGTITGGTLGSSASTNLREQVINNCKLVFGSHISPLYRRIYDVERSTYDLLTVLNLHSAQLKTNVDNLQSALNSVNSAIRNNNLSESESTINAIQLEQAQLKKSLVSKYRTRLNGANYLPSHVDYTQNQLKSTKNALSKVAILKSGPKKHFVAVGLTSGLLENLRYQNVLSTNEHKFTIRLKLSDLQVPQALNLSASGNSTSQVIEEYKFSSRLFIDETEAPNAVSFNKIGLKLFTSNGSYRTISKSDAARLLGEDTVNNHIISHYAYLTLLMTNGIRVEESIFNLRSREQSYPDTDRLSEYITTFQDYIISRPDLGDTTEEKLFVQRVTNDISRSTYFSPFNHFLDMTTSKKFERVFIIPVDLSKYTLLEKSSKVSFPNLFVDIEMQSTSTS